jgi:hypothetical protein
LIPSRERNFSVSHHVHITSKTRLKWLEFEAHFSAPSRAEV